MAVEDSSGAEKSPKQPDASWAGGLRTLVRGVVFGASGSPAGAGVSVTGSFSYRCSTAFVRTVTDERSTFRIAVPEAATWSAAWPQVARGKDGLVVFSKLESATFDLTAQQGETSVSHATLLQFAETGESSFVVLRLLSAGRVRLRVVDGSGGGVPGARIKAYLWPGRVPPASRSRTYSGGFVDIEANASGDAEFLAPAGKVRVWARKPRGVFGALRDGIVEAGEVLDLGDVPAAAARAGVRLRVTTTGQEPVAAMVRIGPDDSVQRWLLDEPGDLWTHIRTGADGTSEFDVAVAPRPLVLGIVAAGHRPAIVIVDRSNPGPLPLEVTLDPLPVLRFRVETDAGRPIPRSVPVRFETALIREDGSFGSADLGASVQASVLLFGPIDDAVKEGVLRADSAPAAELAPAALSTIPTYDPGRQEYRRTVLHAGRYLVRATLVPGLHGEVFVSTSPAGQPGRIRFPTGRAVRLRVHAPPGREETVRRLAVWLGTGSMPPSDWPANKREARDAGLMGSRPFSGARPPFDTTVWVARGFTHLAVAPFRRKIMDVGLRIRISGPPGVPGAERHAGTDPGFRGARLVRLPIPDGDAPVVSYSLPPGEGLGTVRARVTVEGQPLALPGILVQARRTAPLRGQPEPAGFRKRVEARTNDEGVALLRLPPAHYEIRVSPFLAPGVGRKVEVSSVDAAVEIAVPLRGR